MEDYADDDFGELYADDVELQTTPASPNAMPEEDVDAEVDGDGNGDAKNNDADGGRKEMVNDDDYIGSDSEDDLNIVLNDEDFPAGGVRNGNGGVVAGVGCDEDNNGDDDFVVVTQGNNLVKNGNCGDSLADGSETVSSDARGAQSQSKKGVKGGYGSQFFRHKYTRTQGSMFVKNMKASKSMGLASYCSSTKGGWNGNACTQNQVSSSSHFAPACTAANPMVVQCGYESFLPWYWSIFDVNIDTLEEKPWRIPGVDITNYFNFGFNENTWKQYCVALEQLWQASVQTGIPVNESAKSNQEAMREQIDQVISPKGRAIQVEDSMVERQPSIDVRRPRSRDSDVIIQIKLHESSDDYSGSVNSNILDASEEGEFIVGNNRNIPSSSSEDNVLYEEQSEAVKKSEDSSPQKRNDMIPGVDKDKHQDQVDQHSEDTAEVPERETKAEGVGIDTCSADPCWIESELSLGDQELSLTSYPDSDSERTEDSVNVDNEKSHSPLRRHLVNSDTDLKESSPLYHKTSKNNGFNRKLKNIAYYSRNKGPLRQERRRQSGRHEPGSKQNTHMENDNDVSHIPLSSARDPSLLCHQFDNYDRQKEQLQNFGSRKRKDISNNRETRLSCYYGGEKVVDDLAQTVHTKYRYRENRDSFRENTNQYFRKNGDEKECFFEHRTLMADNEDSEREWFHADRGHCADADGLSPLSYRDSRKFLPKHSSLPAKERDMQRRRMHEKPYFRDRNSNNDQWFDECEFEFLNKSYRMSTSFTEREMGSLNNKHELWFPYIDRELKRSAKRGRYHDRPTLFLNNLWSGKMEDECPKYRHHQTSNYVYGTTVNEKFGGCGRHKHASANRGSDWYCGYTDAGKDDDRIIYPVKECEFYSPPSKVLHCTEDEVIFRHHDELLAEEDAFSYEETPRHEMHAKYGYLHDNMQIDDIKMQQHQLIMPRRDSDSFLKGSSKIMCRGKCGQAGLRCRKSVDLVNGEGKSQARSSREVYNRKFENVDWGNAKKRTALVGFNDSHKKAIKSDTAKSERDHKNEKRLENHSDEGQKEDLDIEEGQIVTEEPFREASVSRRNVSEGTVLTDSVKKSMSPNGNNSDRDTCGYDSQRILDTLAKMEKRRERFKQPISMKNEAEKSLKINSDSIVDTGEMKQHRPARKRRWNGS